VPRAVDLVAQVADVDVHDVGAALVREIPDVLDQVRPGEGLAGPPHQLVQQRELLGRQRDAPLAPVHRAGRRVEHQVADVQLGGTFQGLAAGQRPHPGQQFVQRERLGEIVVGAGVQAADLVEHGVAGGEHEHRHPAAAGADLPAHLEAVRRRDHRVEHHHVVVGLDDAPDGVRAGADSVHRVAAAAQAAGQHGGHRRVVLDQ
jgi:hypothetical protein